MFDYLLEILNDKQQEILQLPVPIQFKQAIQKNSLSVIAEIKRKSPSKGILNSSLDPAWLAREYAAGGAAAISVLTDEKHFGGSLHDLKAVIEACPEIPVLRKDFIIDVKQIYQTARAGAHAVLLIAGLLNDRLPEFVRIAKSYGLEALVEVHDVHELHLAHVAGAEMIGVNDRNLTTSDFSLETAITLASHVSPSIVKVAESGILDLSHASQMRQAGYDAILVGEQLVEASNPRAFIEELKNAQ